MRIAAPDTSGARLVWQRRDHPLGAWPSGLSEEVVGILDQWSPFAEERGYPLRAGVEEE